ncbi:MAG: trypsin-like peptidase domain-containing protein [Oscillospiraceae bacterium]|nr:trypsin-like peptidase domain-containing protein [Oscillospiraceae bacterium]
MDDKYEQDNGYSAVYTAPQSSGCTGPEPEKKQKKSVQLTMSKVIALALCCSLVGGILGAGGVALLGGGEKDSTTILEGERPSSAITVAQIDTSREMTPAEVYAQNVNSTVGITTSVTTNFWGYQTTAAVSGSGFILTEDGYILTNFHVIEDSNSVTVTAYDGTTYDATVVGYDESNDIAVLKVEAEGLTPVVLGDSDDLNVGDTVVAIGNPLGELTFSLTSGVVSALDREVTMSSGVTMDLIQTDCAINSGNSGGALFNLYGEVIGITNAKYSGSGSSGQASIDNIGFAIPINSVRNIVESIIENGYIVKPYIGVSVTDVSAETQSYGLPQGAAVKEVTEGSPAEQAGLQVNDIITRVGDTEITCSDDLVSLVKECQAGDELVMQVYRSGETLELTVTVAEKQQSALEVDDESQKSAQSNSQMINPWQFFFGGQS